MDYDRPHDEKNFYRFLSLCEKVNINITKAKQEYKAGTLQFAILYIYEDNDEITLTVSSCLAYGYSFCSRKPNGRHLTLKNILYNFDQLVVKKNETLLEELYSREYDWFEKVIH
jgi:hypothetical protein